jgi:hypothetical protein
MKNKMAKGDDDVPGYVLKLLGEGGLKILTKLINNIYETREWPKDFTEDTVLALKEKPHETKCGEKRTITRIAHKAKIIAKMLRIRIERKMEDEFGEDQFGFRRGKVTGDSVGMLRIISERTLEIYEELCICFIDWQKAFDRDDWTKLMQIIKGTGIDWREGKVSSTCKRLRVFKYDWTEGSQEVCRLEEELQKDAVCHQYCSKCTANALPMKLWKGVEISK